MENNGFETSEQMVDSPSNYANRTQEAESAFEEVGVKKDSFGKKVAKKTGGFIAYKIGCFIKGALVFMIIAFLLSFLGIGFRGISELYSSSPVLYYLVAGLVGGLLNVFRR